MKKQQTLLLTLAMLGATTPVHALLSRDAKSKKVEKYLENKKAIRRKKTLKRTGILVSAISLVVMSILGHRIYKKGDFTVLEKFIFWERGDTKIPQNRQETYVDAMESTSFEAGFFDMEDNIIQESEKKEDSPISPLTATTSHSFKKVEPMLQSTSTDELVIMSSPRGTISSIQGTPEPAMLVEDESDSLVDFGAVVTQRKGSTPQSSYTLPLMSSKTSTTSSKSITKKGRAKKKKKN